MWIKPNPSYRWTKRTPITINNLSGSSPKDVTVDLSNLGDWFWDSVETNGYDLRVTTSDGNQSVPFEREASWNVGNRAGVLSLSNLTLPHNDAMCPVWLYFKTSATPADGSTTVTPATPLTGHVEPNGQIATTAIVRWRPERRGATTPRHHFTKASADELYIWWDLRAQLQRFRRARHGSRLYEEVDYFRFEVLQSGSPVASVFDEAAGRLFHPAIIRTKVKAGTNTQSYTPSLTVVTTLGRTINARCKLTVQDVSEA